MLVVFLPIFVGDTKTSLGHSLWRGKHPLPQLWITPTHLIQLG